MLPATRASFAASSRPDATDGTAAIISTQSDTVNAAARVAHSGPSARRGYIRATAHVRQRGLAPAMVADAMRGFAPPESEGSLYMRLGRMCASVGVQRAEDFDERAHLLEPLGACTTELPAAAAASLDSAQGRGAAPARLRLPAVTAGPSTPPGARRPPMRGRDLCAAACRERGAQICASRHDA